MGDEMKPRQLQFTSPSPPSVIHPLSPSTKNTHQDDDHDNGNGDENNENMWLPAESAIPVSPMRTDSTSTTAGQFLYNRMQQHDNRIPSSSNVLHNAWMHMQTPVNSSALSTIPSTTASSNRFSIVPNEQVIDDSAEGLLDD
jgi:hypothetical protein